MKYALLFILTLSINCFGSGFEEIYAKYGIDQTGRDWSIEEYKKFEVATKDKHFPLPMLNSSMSGKVFKSLTSEGSLKFYSDGKMTSGEILQSGAALIQSVRAITLAYYDAHNRKVANYEKEMAALLSYMTKVAADMVKHTDTFIKTLNPSEFNQARKDGLSMIRAGSINILNGLVVSIGEGIYSKSSVLVMSKSLDENIGSFVGSIPENLKQELTKKIEFQTKLHNDKEIKDHLNSAIKKLNK